MNQQFIDKNEDTPVCCFGFCPDRSLTPLEIEMSYDENDNDIIFKKKNSTKNLPNKPITFYSSRFELGNNDFLLRKISSDGNTYIILTYQEDDKERILLDGILVINGKKFKVIDFKPLRSVKVGEDTYDWVCECIYEAC